MAERITIMHHLSLAAALISAIYAIMQLLVLGLSINDLNEQRIRQDNMQINSYGGGIDPYRNSMPGMYQRFLDMPQRRRVTALFVLHITLIVLACIHVLASMLLIWGVVKRNRNFIWPWIPSAVIIALISMSYSIVWFTGDCFRWWLVIAWFEMLTAIPILVLLIAIILLYYLMLMNYFTDSGRQQNYGQAQYQAGNKTPQQWQEPAVYYPPQPMPQQQQYYTPQPTPVQQPTPTYFQPIQTVPQQQIVRPQYVPAQHQSSVLHTPAPTPQPDVYYQGIDPKMLEMPPREHCVFCTPNGTMNRHEMQQLLHEQHHAHHSHNHVH